MALKIISLFPLFLIASFQAGFIDASRSDYTYIASIRGSYKLHTNEANWTDARDTCWSEGGQLFHPEDEEELNQVIGRLFGNNTFWFFTGISDLEVLKQYKTLDGRPISEVYSEWSTYEPNSLSGGCRCGVIDSRTRKLYINGCSNKTPFICKIKGEGVLTTEIEQLKTVIANVSNKITELEQQVAKQPSMMLERIAEAIANQTTAIERIAEAVANHTVAIDRIMGNQAATLEQIAQANVNQTTAMQQLASAIQQQTADVRLLAVNQTAAMERQALALKKLGSSKYTNGGRSEQELDFYLIRKSDK